MWHDSVISCQSWRCDGLIDGRNGQASVSERLVSSFSDSVGMSLWIVRMGWGRRRRCRADVGLRLGFFVDFRGERRGREGMHNRKSKRYIEVGSPCVPSEFPDRGGFDLSNPFTSQREEFSDAFERSWGGIVESEPHRDHLLFLRRQNREELSGYVPHLFLFEDGVRTGKGLIRNEVADGGSVLFVFMVDGVVEGGGFEKGEEDVVEFLDGDAERERDFRSCRSASQLLLETEHRAMDVGSGFPHV